MFQPAMNSATASTAGPGDCSMPIIAVSSIAVSYELCDVTCRDSISMSTPRPSSETELSNICSIQLCLLPLKTNSSSLKAIS